MYGGTGWGCTLLGLNSKVMLRSCEGHQFRIHHNTFAARSDDSDDLVAYLGKKMINVFFFCSTRFFTFIDAESSTIKSSPEDA